MFAVLNMAHQEGNLVNKDVIRIAHIYKSMCRVHATTRSKALGHRNVLAVQHIQNSSVRRLLLEIVIPQQRAALAIERARHPAVLVIHALYDRQHQIPAVVKRQNLPKA
jgi:hypothetical protein